MFPKAWGMNFDAGNLRFEFWGSRVGLKLKMLVFYAGSSRFEGYGFKFVGCGS